MAEVRTRDEAIEAIDGALERWRAETIGLWAQAATYVNTAVAGVDGELRAHTARRQAAEAHLSAARTEEEVDRFSRIVQAATAAQLSTYQALQAATDAQQRFHAAHRRAARVTEELVPPARADLRRRSAHLGTYRSAGGARSSTSSPSTRGRSSRSGPAVGAYGLEPVAVAALDFADNPIIGEFGRGGMKAADYRWLVETWDAVVAPGLARGLTRDDFAARDAKRDAQPGRRTTDVYDCFLGDTDRIRLTRRPDGSFDVINGRHRIEVARQLGVTSLPGEVR